MSTGEPVKTRTLRRDAQRNREKLVAAAMEVFAERGLDAPLEEVARRADVSIGTLYNRFPTREALVQEIVPALMRAQHENGMRAVVSDDPWEGFVGFVTTMCELQARNRGLTDALSTRFPTAQSMAEACGQSPGMAAEIIARAQENGSLRADFTAQDLMYIVWANGRVVQATESVVPGAWRRSLAFTLDGLRAEAARPVDQPPMSQAQVDQAMHRLTGGSAT